MTTPRFATISELHIYPVKSCAGIPLSRARLTETGFEHDRRWMIVRPNGRFVTQREEPRLALIRPQLSLGALHLSAPGLEELTIDPERPGNHVEVVCWQDRCLAIDEGDLAAQWLERHLGSPHRLVRFDPANKRASNRAWTGDREALNQFSDGYPWLLISRASLDALNSRLERPLPMNRFRPNIAVTGLEPFEEDEVVTLSSGSVVFSPVKPCTRCAITTTNQQTGEREGDEPLRTLRTFRFNSELRGVAFGQNVIALSGFGEWLEVGQQLLVRRR
ncbi:MAG TPA: MOSC N-terminal beta barrel domain-containing protein [Steroidobacteraceae bacterium]